MPGKGGVRRDFPEYRDSGYLWIPVPRFCGEVVVQKDPRQVIAPRNLLRVNRVIRKSVIIPACRLPLRH